MAAAAAVVLVAELGDKSQLLALSYAARGSPLAVLAGIAVAAAAVHGVSALVRVNSAGYRADVVEAAERHDAVFSVTARRYERLRAAIEALAADPNHHTWSPALGTKDCPTAHGDSAVAEAPFRFAGRDVRLIVRRQPTAPGDQAELRRLGRLALPRLVTNAPFGTAAEVEHHHRRRGGVPEVAIRQLKEDFVGPELGEALSHQHAGRPEPFEQLSRRPRRGRRPLGSQPATWVGE